MTNDEFLKQFDSGTVNRKKLSICLFDKFYSFKISSKYDRETENNYYLYKINNRYFIATISVGKEDYLLGYKDDECFDLIEVKKQPNSYKTVQIIQLNFIGEDDCKYTFCS